MAKAKKLPSGNYRVQAKITVDGKQVIKSFTASTAKKAETMASLWQLGETAEATESITLKKAYEKYIDSKDKVLSPSTLKAYRSMLRNSFQDIMPIKIDRLTQLQIQTSVNILSASHSPKFVRNAHGLLTAVLRMFRPSLQVTSKLPAREKTELYIPDDEEVRTLIKSVKGSRLEIPVLLAAFGPMRRGEICALTSDDVVGNIITVNKSMVKDLNNQWIVKQPKTYASYRQIEYPDFVINSIKRKKGKLTDMTPSAITDAFPDALDKAGLPHFRFHDLRHYAVSTLHAINVPDKYIMARGGWATNYTMQNVYNHALKSAADAMDNKINAHFENIFE